jgi:hypothetical protein
MRHVTGVVGRARSKLALIVDQPSAKQNLYPIESHRGSAARLARFDTFDGATGLFLSKGCFKPKALLPWSRRFPIRLLCCSAMVPSVPSSADN